MPAITKDQIDHIAKLARIRLTDAEEEKMAKELGAILAYVEKLNEVDTKDIEPTAQVTGLLNVMREDPTSLEKLRGTNWWDGNPADLVQTAPEHDGKYVRVKGVFDANDK